MSDLSFTNAHFSIFFGQPGSNSTGTSHACCQTKERKRNYRSSLGVTLISFFDLILSAQPNGCQMPNS
jgi:hypothetical protein